MDDNDTHLVAQQLVDDTDVFAVDETLLAPDILDARQRLEGRIYPMASNTQHVEGGVHSAKVVAGPGRFEPLRSALEIIRSMSDEMNRNKMKNDPSKSFSFLEEIEERSKMLKELEQKIGMHTLEASVENVVKLCRKDHYEKIRIGLKKEKHLENLNKPDKKLNMRQNEINPTYTAEAVDERRISSLREKDHHRDLNCELTFRGIEWKEVKKMRPNGKKASYTFTDKKMLLKRDEEIRRQGDKEYENGFFKPLSNAPFYIPPKE